MCTPEIHCQQHGFCSLFDFLLAHTKSEESQDAAISPVCLFSHHDSAQASCSITCIESSIIVVPESAQGKTHTIVVTTLPGSMRNATLQSMAAHMIGTAHSVLCAHCSTLGRLSSSSQSPNTPRLCEYCAQNARRARCSTQPLMHITAHTMSKMLLFVMKTPHWAWQETCRGVVLSKGRCAIISSTSWQVSITLCCGPCSHVFAMYVADNQHHLPHDDRNVWVAGVASCSAANLRTQSMSRWKPCLQRCPQEQRHHPQRLSCTKWVIERGQKVCGETVDELQLDQAAWYARLVNKQRCNRLDRDCCELQQQHYAQSPFTCHTGG